MPQVSSGETFKVLQANGGNEIEIKKNGYLYIYVSCKSGSKHPDNESLGNVYFDDLRIEHTNGPLVEETHYYPFGLTMNGISSKALTQAKGNRYQYNGKEKQDKEFTDGTGLEWLDYDARYYDAQLGRFFQVDLLADLIEETSPYAYVLNNPLKFIDPTGMNNEKVKVHEPVVVYTDKYRKKVHDKYKKYDNHDWEMEVYRLRKRGMTDDQIRNHFVNLPYDLRSRVEKGMYFDSYNKTRREMGYKFDKIVLNLIVNLIPAGRLIKSGGQLLKVVGFVKRMADKPFVRQFGGDFLKELGQEAAENWRDLGKIDVFDALTNAAVGGKSKLIQGGVEVANSFVDLSIKEGPQVAFIYRKDGKSVGIDLIFAFPKLQVMSMNAPEKLEIGIGMALDQGKALVTSKMDD